ncbi:MAG TPA: T9SS type A sorting domain-containing protein [Candidatus Marinimicrobia bacterium]|nr:T9SS type A sorting domain-containing protein [Candidatus Neomarinimicrobiota bacterium]
MKRLIIPIIFLSFTFATDKSPVFNKAKVLDLSHKKKLSERFQYHEKIKGFERTAKMSTKRNKISKGDYTNLLRSINGRDRGLLEKEGIGPMMRSTQPPSDTRSLFQMNEDLYGRWKQSKVEEGAYVTLESAVTIPDLEQFIGYKSGLGSIGVTGEGSVQMTYMLGGTFLNYAQVAVSNYGWFQEIPDGSIVYDVVFNYFDPSTESFDEYVDYMTSVNLKHPTSGSLFVYEWGSDEDEGIWIPFGAGSIPEDAFTFNMGLLSLTFDGAGSMTIVEPEDPTNPETETYSVADDGVFSLEGEVSGIVNPSGDLLVIAFGDDKESVLAIGMKTATGTTAASVAGTYVGATINQDIYDEGEAYVELFGVIFDGVGTYIMQTADATTPTTGTYSVSEDGVLTLDDGTVGYITSDGTFGVITSGSDSENSFVGFTIKEGSEKSAASLDGTYMFNGLDMEWDEEDESYYYHFSGAEVAFDGNGNYTVSEGDETETGTYSVSANGVLTIDGDEEIGYVSANDEFIVLAEANDEFASAGIAIKKSSGMTDASLTGTFMTGFVDYSADFEMVSVEDEVNLEFLGIEDSVVTAELESIDYEDYWVEFSFPAPIEISIGDLSISGEDYEGNTLEYSFSGNLSYGKTTLPPGIPLPLPSLSDLVEDENETHFMEFQKDHLGREIWQYTYPEDDWEWIDTTDYVWTTKGDTLILTMKVWEWDEEAEEEYLTYEKIEIPYSVANSILTLGGDIMPCEDWEEDWWESWEDCIEGEYWVLSLALDFLDDDQIKDYFVRHKATLNYEGEVPAKPTLVSTLPMVNSMPNIFMQDMEISGNRLYAGGDAYFDGTKDRYLRIIDISNPKNPKELAFTRPADANDSYLFDMVVKGNVLITNDNYGPNFYNVEDDKITTGVGSYHLDFDGTDDYVDLGVISTTNFTTADFSIQAWVKTTSTKEQSILVKGDADGVWESGEKALYMESAGYPWFVGYDNEYIPGTGLTVNDGKWHHIVATWDYSGSGESGNAAIYVDGVKATVETSYRARTIDNSSDNLYIGAVPFFDGSLKEIAIWSQALTANEVSNLYYSGSGRAATTVQTAKVVGYWELDEGSGSTVTDESGNSNNGTISGATWARNASGGIAATKCCFGEKMALHGNNLYIPTGWDDMQDGFRIIDVTVPTLPSIIKDVELGDLDDDDDWSPWFTDIHASDSYVYILDWGGGQDTDGCEDANVLRVHSASSPYAQVATFNIGYADKMEIAGSFLYTTSCGDFRIYDISDVSNITKVATLYPGHDQWFESWNGEIEKVGNYVYIATGGNDDWWDKGIDIIDVTHHTAPVHVGRIPSTKRNEDLGGGLDYPVRSVEVSGGYVYVPQQSSGTEDGAKGSLSIYQNDFAPQPFSLMFPPDGMTIEITSENAWEDSILFAWSEAVDIEGSSMMYQHEVTGDLADFFLISSNMTSNTWSIPYHHVKYYMDQAGVSVVTGTWNIWASDGVSNVWSGNGPYQLTIDATGLTVENGDLLPDQFQLHANFPNPFNPTTSIKYDLPENAAVSLMIYDIMGREIRHLVNETQNAGFKAIMWDGTNSNGNQVGTGMYLYHIKAGSFVQTRKMILMK